MIEVLMLYRIGQYYSIIEVSYYIASVLKLKKKGNQLWCVIMLVASTLSYAIIGITLRIRDVITDNIPPR